ncbi:hypothetical protein [Lacticaseibacillus sp. GG6-2]
MKKFALLIAVVAVAALVAIIQVVNVSAVSSTNPAIAQIQNDDFYTPQAYISQKNTGINHGADTLSFAGVSDKASQVQIADLFSNDTNALNTVNYTVDGSTLVVDQSDLPAGVSAYSAQLNDDGTTITVREVKNGVTRTRNGSAVNRTNDQLSKVAADR